jgi:hypothetical protein
VERLLFPRSVGAVLWAVLGRAAVVRLFAPPLQVLVGRADWAAGEAATLAWLRLAEVTLAGLAVMAVGLPAGAVRANRLSVRPEAVPAGGWLPPDGGGGLPPWL